MSERTKATISIAALVFVQIAALAGVHIEADTVIEVLSCIVVVCVTIYAAWKNHNFTDAAAAAQSFMRSLKDGDAGEDGSDA